MILLYKARLKTIDLVIQHVCGGEGAGKEETRNLFDRAFQLLE